MVRYRCVCGAVLDSLGRVQKHVSKSHGRQVSLSTVREEWCREVTTY